ncbi:MmgE/PrpD family protein [Falsiroseomonas stagni]|uniref:2-methylcitrate dehydratase PrpD n=1 Tax=Falsiroseomonas stagni DSM 19981 TaxID=1123062 RepID=A0A1I4CTI4_9PROT|nr:MmgE/PrpD family protein [Falsiroseomonas stagni]SFK84572.1 2-methylcitrate dehydratase PrpD [Falsiroseomonas stagni DSM 19981]
MTFSSVIAWAAAGPPPGSAAAAKARLLLLDSLGCALAGLRHPRVAAYATAMQHAFPGDVALAGARLAPAAAAAVLAAATCWDEANEGLASAHGRPALPVAPLALVARARGADTPAALAAFALGYEVAARAGQAWRIRPGMHVDGSWHSLGAAACAAALAGLDPGGIGRAVRLAACQIPFSLYAPIAAGMDGRNSYASHAALLGSLAAAGACAGMDAPDSGFAEGRRIALGHEAPAQVAPPGEWLLEAAYLKPFAGVRHAHYGAAAAIELRRTLAQGSAPSPNPLPPPGGEGFSRITLSTYAEALRYAGNRAPQAAIAAQFSLTWAVAAALVQGDLGPAAYTDEALADPALRALEASIELREDPALTAAGLRGATLTIGEHSATITGVTGDPDRPMSEAEALAKFRRFATPTLGEAGATAAIAALLHDQPAKDLFG